MPPMPLTEAVPTRDRLSGRRSWDPATTARALSVPSVGLVLLAVVASPLLPSGAGPTVLVAAGLVGLPHGAVDHLALGWARGRTGAAPAAVLLGYALAAVVAAVASLAAPVPALLVLLVLSAAHFAEGERAFDRLRGGTGGWLPAVALGTCVVFVPLVLRPGSSRPLLAALDAGLPDLLLEIRTPLLLGCLALVLAGLVASVHRPQVAAELAVVAVACLLTAPLVVFGVWFACWHSPRHLVRLAALEPDGDGRQRAGRLVRGAVGPTVVALVGLGILVLLLGALPGALLIVLLALTVPHAAVVARLDRIASGATSES